MQTRLSLLWTRLRADMQAQIEALRLESDAGYTTEAVLVTAALVIIALAALTILATKVAAKAQNIDLGLSLW